MLTLFVILLWPIRALRFEVRGYFIIGMSSVLIVAVLVFLLFLKDDARRRHRSEQEQVLVSAGPPPVLVPAGPPPIHDGIFHDLWIHGPSNWPLIGFWSQLGSQPYRTLGDLADLFGPICRVYLGQQRVLVINSHAVLDEIISKKSAIFQGFPLPTALPIIGHVYSTSSRGRIGLLNSDEDVTEVHRVFLHNATTQLKNSVLENLVKSELELICEEIHGRRGESTDFRQLLPRSWVAVLERMLLGSGNAESDPAFARILNLLQRRNDIATKMGPYLALPWLRRLPLLASATKYNRLMELESEFQDCCFRLTSNYEADLEGGQHCFLDMYLAEQRSRQTFNCDDLCFNVEQLTADSVVLLEHLHEAPWASSLWALQLMARYPDVQERVHAELSALYTNASVSSPRWSDRHRLPYTWSTLAEIRRTAPVLPLISLPMNMENTSLSGFEIPARSCLLANAWRINGDPDFWNDPQHFRPERFCPLPPREGATSSSSGGEQRRAAEHVLPYFLGPKTWVDNDVVLMPVFLMMTTLLLRFQFLQPDDQLVCEDGFTLKPAGGQLRAVSR